MVIERPYQEAAEEGHVGVVGILLGQRKTVDSIAKYTEHSYSAIEWAVLRGGEAAVKVLLKQRDVVMMGQRLCATYTDGCH